MPEDKQAGHGIKFATVSASARSADFRDIYTNSSRVGVTPWDFAITFALSKEIPGGTSINEDQATVRMSPQQFKIFTHALLSTVTVWEEVYGEIALNGPELDAEKLKVNILNLRDAAFKKP